MNRCFWSKVLGWLWGGIKGIGETIAVLFFISLFIACWAGIGYGLTSPIPDASPVVQAIVFSLRLLVALLALVCLIKNVVFEVGAKIRGFMEECER